MDKIENIEDVKKAKLFGNSNFDSIINESLQVLSNNPELIFKSNMDISDTPISPMVIEDDYTPILFSHEVVEKYKELVRKINIEETAKEYSYMILGKKAKFTEKDCYIVDKLIDCSLENVNLSSRETQIDEDKLNQTVQFALHNGYNFISLGHTHPKIKEQERATTIANYLKDEVKNSEYIRDAGLNLSLQDFISYESLYQYFVTYPNIRTCQTVIMYNGEMAMVSKENSSVNRFVILMDMTTGEELYVSSKEEFEKSKENIL